MNNPTANNTTLAGGEAATRNDLFTRAPFHAPGRPYMPMSGRAAQFAPYKSLTGYEDLVLEKTAELSSSVDQIILDLDSDSDSDPDPAPADYQN